MRKFVAIGTEKTLHCSSIEPLSPQLNREKPQKLISGWQKLLVNVEKVNLLSEQLEAALFELKVTANEIKCDQNAPQISHKIFRHKLIAIPYIHYKRPGLVVLATKKIDLFQQERETIQIAQMLRRRTKKRLKRRVSNKLLKSSRLGYQHRNFLRQLVLIWQKLIIAIARKLGGRNRSKQLIKLLAVK
ncbi:hypothetical protein [Synechocystis sp. PCC 7509]|uniref:hypothetical protein n=1 Tax=Synechocystis sp. PCC 7509 TaxID=927677 RepID=UPI0002AC7535|nr:hypothetical protein [Synechocystis sp. PCC 7509]